MKPFFLFTLILFVLISCGEKKKAKMIPPLTKEEKEQIVKFAIDLKKSMNNYQYDLIQKSWDGNAFMKRVKGLNKTERRALNSYFKTQLKSSLELANTNVINQLKYNNGRVKLAKVKQFQRHSELTYTLVTGEHIRFVRYLVKMINGVPKLCDYFILKENFWFSQKIKSLVKLEVGGNKYDNLRISNALVSSDRLKQKGQISEAFEVLYEVPSTSMPGNYISHKKLDLAYALNDTIYLEVLMEEYEANKSPHIRYLYHWFFQDTADYMNILDSLAINTGEEQIIDSVKAGYYLWY